MICALLPTADDVTVALPLMPLIVDAVRARASVGLFDTLAQCVLPRRANAVNHGFKRLIVAGSKRISSKKPWCTQRLARVAG